jgi:hypothetical protein
MRTTSILTLLACLGALVLTAPGSASSMAGRMAKTQGLSDGLVTKVNSHHWWGRHRRYYYRHFYYSPYFCSLPYYYYYWPFYYPICYRLYGHPQVAPNSK